MVVILARAHVVMVVVLARARTVVARADRLGGGGAAGRGAQRTRRGTQSRAEGALTGDQLHGIHAGRPLM
jgi:hypothetical protein